MFPFTALLDLVYPRWCAACGGPVTGEGLHICWSCLAEFQAVTSPLCRWCGDPIEGQADHDFDCGQCKRLRPGFDLARSALRYRGSLRRALQVFKYERAACLHRDFVPMLLATVTTHCRGVPFDGVTFVPLHPRRERERTYNQARLLAKGLAAALDAPFAGDCLRRTRSTMTQTDLSAAARRQNVSRAFAVSKQEWLEGRTLLLVDDVMTTGATVDECARALKQGGAHKVYVVTVARG